MHKDFITDEPQIPFRTFQWYGFFIGGIIPIVLLIIFQSIGIKESLIDSNAFGCILIHTIIISIIAIILLHFESRREKLKWNWWGLLFLVQAVFAFFLTHILVVFTGGAKTSVFAFSYIYIPSIVGYAFGKGINLYGAAIVLSISYFFNLFFPIEGKTIFESYIQIFNKIGFTSADGINIGILYLAIFLIQLFVLIVIAGKKDSLGQTDKVNLDS